MGCRNACICGGRCFEFEKEADYIKARKESKDKITKVISVWSAREETIHDEGFQKGATFGYNKAKEEMIQNGLALQSDMDKTIEQNIALKKELNKANEWHYVKDGDYPKDDKQYLVLFFYNYKGKKEMSFGVRDNLHSDFEIKRCYTEQIIAWKEIVLPKEKKND